MIAAADVTSEREQADARSGVGIEHVSALTLLRLEGETRAVLSLDELQILIANETARVLAGQQCLVFAHAAVGTLKLSAVNGLSRLERSPPLLQHLESVVARLGRDGSLSTQHEFQLSAFTDTGSNPTARLYPFDCALWAPILDREGALCAGVLLTRDQPWRQSEVTILLSSLFAYAYAWQWHASRTGLRSRLQPSRRTALAAAATVAVLGFWPVSMTTLAALEIAPRDAALVSAAIDGAIEEIPVQAGTAVRTGDVLARLSDTVLRNRLEVAKREVEVAEAKAKKTALLAVDEMRGRHDLAIARSELKVKLAERDFARELLSNATIRAPRDGIAVVSDRRDLIGKPVVVGERILEIADETLVEARIYVPVSDVIVLQPGARAKLFLDSAPLRPVEAEVVAADYHAKTHNGGPLSFRVTARLTDSTIAPPRLGARGTAQVYGDTVSLYFYLLRRPISAFRQWFGV